MRNVRLRLHKESGSTDLTMSRKFSGIQQIALVTLRTLIGWHLLYEGYYKLALPGWSRAGTPITAWTSAGYIKAATGPIARVLQKMIDAGWANWIDNTVKIGLLLIGLSLILGLFTRAGSLAALVLLVLFYLLSVPLSGTQQPGSEGAYLIVNKTLIEAAGVFVVLVSRTELMAGLDLLLARRISARVQSPLASQPEAKGDEAVEVSTSVESTHGEL
jgi:thiosulfate dehydrogenase [quinone] large subunit